MSFDDDRLLRLTRDIERYLGYLKGNELVREYTDAQNLDAEDQASQLSDGFLNTFPADLYTSTPEESEFACDFYALAISAPFYGTDEPTSESRRFFREIAEGMEQSWGNGVDWARGMGGELRAICKPFTSPDPQRLNEIAEGLVSLSSARLAGLLPNDFAAHSDGINFGSTLDGWHGRAANTFQTFYDNLSDRGNGYAVCIGLAAGWVAGSAGLIAAAQSGVLDFLESVREGLVLQLEEWAETHGNPQDWPKPADWGLIGDIAGVASDIAELIPVVDKFKKVPGVISDVAELVRDVGNVTNKVNSYVGDNGVDKVEARTEFHVETAADLWTAATTVLYDEILHELKKGLDDLADESRRGIRMLHNLQEDGDWLPHQVGTTVFSAPWTHYSDL